MTKPKETDSLTASMNQKRRPGHNDSEAKDDNPLDGKVGSIHLLQAAFQMIYPNANVKVNGIIGDELLALIQKYQKERGLNITTSVGPDTVSELTKDMQKHPIISELSQKWNVAPLTALEKMAELKQLGISDQFLVSFNRTVQGGGSAELTPKMQPSDVPNVKKPEEPKDFDSGQK